MGDADELLFVLEGDDALPVPELDRARSPQARRVEAREFVEEEAACRIDPAFWHEVKATPRPSHVRYYGTTRQRQSIQAPQGWADCARSSRAIDVANRR
jgi:hypothetical protein